MIGIFDSGSGGLTVLRAIRDEMPSADIVYFGDIRNAPYGTKSADELRMLTAHALELLRARGAEHIVSACNSVSASLTASLSDSLSLAPTQLIEMVGPTVSRFQGSQERILLVATQATINSGIYQNAFRMIGKDIVTRAIPQLAAAIEFAHDDAEIEESIAVALRDIDPAQFDVLILACTHYPLVAPVFSRVLSLPHFDPALAVASRVKAQWGTNEIGRGAMHFLVSADSEPFRARVAEFFPTSETSIEVLD